MTPDFAERLAKIEAELAIRNLLAAYCFALDDRDVPGLRALFSADARVWTADGKREASGGAAADFYIDRFPALGVTNHVLHQFRITIESPIAARGMGSGHAEVFADGKQLIAAVRYHDRYAREGDRWTFAERCLDYVYVTPVEAYPGVLGAHGGMPDGPPALPAR